MPLLVGLENEERLPSVVKEELEQILAAIKVNADNVDASIADLDAGAYAYVNVSNTFTLDQTFSAGITVVGSVTAGSATVTGGVTIAGSGSISGQWSFSAATPIILNHATTAEIVATAANLRLSSNNSVIIEIDRNDDGAETFQIQDGAGAIIMQLTEAGAVDFASSITAGSGNVEIVDSTGKIPALSSTYFASLSGANLTSLNASNISSGTLDNARLAATVSIGALITTGDVTVGDQLVVSGVGPHAIGTSVNTGRQVLIAGTFSPSGAVSDGMALGITSRINAEVGIDAMGLFVQPRLAEAASGTHNIFASAQILAYDVTLGSAAVTNGTALYINGAPTNATNNYALWVDAGTVRVDGDMTVGAGLTILTGGDLDVVDFIKLETASNSNYNGASAPTNWHGTPATAGLGQPPVWFRAKNRSGTEYRIPGYSA